MSERANVNKSDEKQVLVASRRKCCLCYFLDGERNKRKGQIAHLNRNSTKSEISNLVYLCLDHHDDFDSRTSQSKGYVISEVEEYRNRLYQELGTMGIMSLASAVEDTFSSVSHFSADMKCVVLDDDRFSFLHKPWRSVWQLEETPELFAFKSHNGHDGVCRIELINLTNGRTAVICEEIDENPGISVTNAVEDIAFQVCEQFDVDPQTLVWIEHYETSFLAEGEWDLVDFGVRPPEAYFGQPEWKPLQERDWHSLGFRPRPKRTKHGGKPASGIEWYS